MSSRNGLTKVARPEGLSPDAMEVREYQIDMVGLLPGSPHQYVLEYYVEDKMENRSWLMGYKETKPPGYDDFDTTPALLSRAVCDEDHRADELWGKFTGYFGPYEFIECVEMFWKTVS